MKSFGLQPGDRLGERYTVRARLGGGTEGEVYSVRETGTGIERAAKLYFPHRDSGQRRSRHHARKLNALRGCPIVLQYHHSEPLTIQDRRVVAVISELCEGLPLYRWVRAQRGKRLGPFMAMHVLYGLVCGLEAVHAAGEYHADVHTENIIIQPRGVRFDLKLIDFYEWGRPSRAKQQQDIADTVRVFYDCLGGQKHYAKQPPAVKHICVGLQRGRLLRRFPSMARLRRHLEQFEWERGKSY